MRPSPVVHSPAMALNNELFPVPLSPTIRMCSPCPMESDRPLTRGRRPSGVTTVTSSICSAEDDPDAMKLEMPWHTFFLKVSVLVYFLYEVTT